MSEASYVFAYEAGLLLRRGMLANVQGLALRMGLDFQHVEDRGWLGGVVQARVSGDHDQVLQCSQIVGQYLRESESW